MNKGLLTIAVAGSMIVGLANMAMADSVIPSASLSTALSAAGCIRIEPAGTGPTLASVGLTVSVTILDSNGDPIADIPPCDVWLDDNGTGDVAVCPGGSIADVITNASGQTTISGAIAGGGHTQSGMNVYVCGVKLTSGFLDIDIVSADINGDGNVNLSDVGNFVSDYRAGTDPFRSDLNCDSSVNLSDVGDFTAAYGSGPCSVNSCE